MFDAAAEAAEVEERGADALAELPEAMLQNQWMSGTRSSNIMSGHDGKPAATRGRGRRLRGDLRPRKSVVKTVAPSRRAEHGVGLLERVRRAIRNDDDPTALLGSFGILGALIASEAEMAADARALVAAAVLPDTTPLLEELVTAPLPALPIAATLDEDE